MVRKRLILILTILLLLTLPVSADILWEPYDNAYYQKHAAGLPYMDHTYLVPENSTATIYKSPKSGGILATVEPGTALYIGPYQEINGETWGSCYVLGNWEIEGWVRLDRLQRKYEHDDFYAEFGDQFIATDDCLTEPDIKTEIIAWTYPGSGEVDRTVPKEALQTGYNDNQMTFQSVYTDPDGGRWGYVGYFMGRCGWVYLDDPENPNAPRFPQSVDPIVVDPTPEEEPSDGLGTLVVLIAALVIVTTGAIVVWKKKSGIHSRKNGDHEA